MGLMGIYQVVEYIQLESSGKLAFTPWNKNVTKWWLGANNQMLLLSFTRGMILTIFHMAFQMDS